MPVFISINSITIAPRGNVVVIHDEGDFLSFYL